MNVSQYERNALGKNNDNLLESQLDSTTTHILISLGKLGVASMAHLLWWTSLSTHDIQDDIPAMDS
ncbi:MAG: hypothetical protein ACREHG_11165 [Candidatus Saccharimonadales bacterium]